MSLSPRILGPIVGASLLVASLGRADEDWPPSVPAVRVETMGVGGYGLLNRLDTSPNKADGVVVGGEVRVHPYSAHGFLVDFLHAAGVFGPGVNVVEAAYSLRLMEGRSLHTVPTGALYFEIGPSLGFVSHAPPDPNHTVLGGRASFAGDLRIGNFAVGGSLGYRGGVPLGSATSPWEAAVTVLGRLGVVFDFGMRSED